MLEDDRGLNMESDALRESERYFPFVGAIPAVWAVLAGASDGVFTAAAFGAGLGAVGIIAIVILRRRDESASGYLIGTALALSAVAYLLFMLAMQPVPAPGEDF